MEHLPDARIIKLWQKLYDIYPREVGIPQRIWVNGFDELVKLITKYEGKRDIYVSVYGYLDKNRTPVIDRIFLDFDSPGDFVTEEVWNEVRNFVKALRKKKIYPVVFFSGRKGFHVYCFFEPTIVRFQSKAIELTVKKLKSFYNLQFLDWRIVGDTSRLARVPYTTHRITKLKCFPIVEELLEKPLSEILKLAKNPPVVDVKIERSKAIREILLHQDEVAAYDIERAKSEFKKPEEEISYLRLPCIRLLFKHKLPPGHRRMKASKFIAIAYYFDHRGSMEGFEVVAELFASRQNIGHKLKKSEVLGWKRGVYQLNNGLGPRWNCAEIRAYLREVLLPIPCKYCKLREIEAKQKLEDVTKELRSEDLLKEIKEVLDYYVVGEDENKLLLYLLLLGKQNVIIKGPSSTGKNTIVEAVLKLFPEDSVVEVSGASKKFLRWMEKDYIPILYVKEVPGALFKELKDEGIALDLKLAMSDKILKIWIADAAAKKTITREIRVDAVVQTTVEVSLPEDIENRVWILTTDISPVQTRKVVLWKASKYTQLSTKADIDKKLRKIREITKSLMESTPVIIPYAPALAEMIPYDNPRVRRDIEKLLELIGTIAKVRGKFVDFGNNKVVVSTPDDAKIAIKLSEKVYMTMVHGYDPLTLELYKTLKRVEKDYGSLTVTLVSETLNVSQRNAQNYLRRLVEVGLAIQVDEDCYQLKNVELRPFTIDIKKLWRETLDWARRAGVLEKLLDFFERFESFS